MEHYCSPVTVLTVDVFLFFFRLGCPGFTKPEHRPSPVEKGVSKSLFFPDEAINRHPRFRYVFKHATM